MDQLSQKIKEKLVTVFDDIQVNITVPNRVVIECPKNNIITMLSHMKGEGFNHLSLISCVDRIEDQKFEVVYILSVYTVDPDMGRINLLIKTKVSRDKPELYTSINVFINAEPFEREIHELFGVHFNGHPRLTPLLLERKYKVPPFRKDFDTRQYVDDFFEQIPTIEAKKANNERT